MSIFLLDFLLLANSRCFFFLQQFPASALSANGRVTTFLDLFSLPQHLKRRICAHRLILNVIVMFVVGALRLLLFFLTAAA
jgi:hypothetical protein